VRDRRRSGHEDCSEEQEQHSQEEVGAGIIIAVRKRDLGRRPEVQILMGNVVRARADIAVVDTALRGEELIVLSWWNLLRHEDAEKECRGEPGKGDEHDPGRRPIEPTARPGMTAGRGSAGNDPNTA
jgi:hypothetical protein